MPSTLTFIHQWTRAKPTRLITIFQAALLSLVLTATVSDVSAQYAVKVINTPDAATGASPPTGDINKPLIAREPTQSWDRLADALVPFIVLAVLFEMALTPLFNWRVFAVRFEGRGVKTPVAFAAALALIYAVDIDVVRDVLNAIYVKGQSGLALTESNFISKAITALLISGGSDGVFRILTKLGVRSPLERVIKAEEGKDAPIEVLGQQGGQSEDHLDIFGKALLGSRLALAGVDFAVLKQSKQNDAIECELIAAGTPIKRISETELAEALFSTSGGKNLGVRPNQVIIANYKVLAANGFV